MGISFLSRNHHLAWPATRDSIIVSFQGCLLFSACVLNWWSRCSSFDDEVMMMMMMPWMTIEIIIASSWRVKEVFLRSFRVNYGHISWERWRGMMMLMMIIEFSCRMIYKLHVSSCVWMWAFIRPSDEKVTSHRECWAVKLSPRSHHHH